MEYRRCFVGIPLPERYQKEFEDVLGDLVRIDPGLRSVESKTPHVLLSFLGNQKGASLNEAADEIRPVAGGLSKTSLTVGGFDSFQNRRTKIIFLQVGGLTEKSDLISLIREKLRRFNPGDKPFRPHLTVARLAADGGISEEIKRRLNQVEWKFPVTAVAIYGAENQEGEMKQKKLIVIPIGNG